MAKFYFLVLYKMSADNFAVGLLGTGTLQAGATLIPGVAFMSQVIPATTNNNAFVLPSNPTLGRPYEIRNDGAVWAQVFPPNAGGTGQINNFGIGNSVPIGVGAVLRIVAYTSAQWYVLSYTGNAPVIPTTGGSTCAAQYSGCIMSVSQGAGGTITLPAPSPGLKFKFIKADAKANTADLKIDCGVGNLLGGWVNTTAAGISAATTAGTPARYFNFLNNACVLGDEVEITCDGTHYNAVGIGGAATCFSIS